MTYDTMKLIIDNARKNNLVTNFNTMTNIRFWDNDTSRIIMDSASDGCYAIFSSNSYAGATKAYGTNNLVCIQCKADAISEAEVGGRKKDVLQFAKDIGLTLNDDDMKVINNINAHNYNLYPETGDYNVFKELSDEEYAKLSDEDKKEYDKEKEIDEAKKKGEYLRDGVAAQITV